MKKSTYTRLPLLLLFILPVLLSSCNKKYLPPEITGTWSIDTSQVFYDAGWDKERMIQYEEITGIDLEKRFVDSYQNVRKEFKQPSSILMLPDNSCQFINQDSIDSGTYVQDGSYITFTFVSGRYPNGIWGVSNGAELTLLVNPQDIIDVITNIAKFTEEEAAFLFEGKTPFGLDFPLMDGNPVIKYLEAYIPFRKISSK
ncbi:MAG: hypothetical protein FWD56_05750 [Bacteroidales bacterium]|nr:hypothetical protein [Bacteroidales bacterium]